MISYCFYRIQKPVGALYPCPMLWVLVCYRLLKHSSLHHHHVFCGGCVKFYLFIFFLWKKINQRLHGSTNGKWSPGFLFIQLHKSNCSVVCRHVSMFYIASDTYKNLYYISNNILFIGWKNEYLCRQYQMIEQDIVRNEISYDVRAIQFQFPVAWLVDFIGHPSLG